VISLAGGIGQLRNQCIGGVATVLMAGIGTLVILKIVDALIGLRVQPEEERAGLDLSQHGENAYNA
jgi:Amt family ammonium transporter